MYLQRLELTDFRNHPAVAVELTPGPSVLVGPNGVGKTNILEAIGYLATLSSHRSGQESNLVRVGAASAVVRASVVRDGRTILIDLEIRPGAGLRGRLNKAPSPRARDLLGTVRATLFAPEDLAMVRGDPEERRRFLDALAVQRLPRHLAIRQDYERILRQRNTLLRSAGGRPPAGGGLATLDVWDEKLASAGGELWAERAYQELAAQPDPVEMTYVSSVLGSETLDPEPTDLARAIRERLRLDRSREIERGVTLSGPHPAHLPLPLPRPPP